MKKFIFSKFSITTIILFSLILGSYFHKKEPPTKTDTHPSTSTKSQTQKHTLPEKKKNPCQASEDIIEHFLKKLPKKMPTNTEEIQIVRTLILQDEELKKIVIKNDKCGASSASWFANLYSDVGLKDKANEFHKMVLDFASKHNMSALADLCDYETVASKGEKLHFCKMIINSNDPTLQKTTKFVALYRLAQFYLDTNQGNEFIRLCKKADDLKDLCFFSYSAKFPSVDNLALKLYNEKQFKQALELYTKIASYDKTGITEGTIAEMYLKGEGTKIDYQSSIIWTKKALEKNYNEKLRPIMMNNMCVAYQLQNDYVQAFNCYKQTAIMGYPLSQVNLARLYVQGHGTIQNNKLAYVWISIAIANGLDQDKQSRAEKLQSALENDLMMQDKAGIELINAKKLTKQYYKQYVLHEKPVQKKKKDLASRLSAAIKELTE